jgi:hypothetical protein
MIVTLELLLMFLRFLSASKLLIPRPDLSVSEAAPCRAPKIVSCERVDVNMSAIDDERIEFTDGAIMSLDSALQQLRHRKSYNYQVKEKVYN